MEIRTLTLKYYKNCFTNKEIKLDSFDEIPDNYQILIIECYSSYKDNKKNVNYKYAGKYINSIECLIYINNNFYVNGFGIICVKNLILNYNYIKYELWYKNEIIEFFNGAKGGELSTEKINDLLPLVIIINEDLDVCDEILPFFNFSRIKASVDNLYLISKKGNLTKRAFNKQNS
ncbi:hypothetical protein Hokovirus_1_306 [Hokovirus HKV1]|uniref:Uncharacterized protein n=1 Tax=Hokovirus HKV1 TaxID=1977638 RepID=A0A1V0SFD9_9VIRU|nr:hypothetical protein Hokovirus_1_306 [Hokovirus HKV1]